MSVVAAKKENGKWVLAADSQVTEGTVKHHQSGIQFNKVFSAQSGTLIIGGAGLAETLICLEVYAQSHKPEPSKLGVIEFMSAFHKWRKDLDENAEMAGGLILAVDGFAFNVIGVSEVCEISEYDALGCASDSAKVAMYLGEGAERAVEIACEFSAHCSAPIQSFSMPASAHRAPIA